MSNVFKITDVVDEKVFTDLKELNKSLLAAKDTYVSVATEMSKGVKVPVGSLEELKGKAAGYEKALKELSEAQKQVISVQAQYNKLLDEVDKRVKRAVAGERERKAAKQSYVLSLQEALKLAQQEVHSVNEANEANKRLRATIRTLRNDVEEEVEAMKVLNEAVDRNSQVINENSDAYTRQKRNVGNYRDVWNGLDMSVQQLIRELPSAATGMNTFFLAISNNLPILIDQLKAANAQVKAAKAAGESYVPVGTQMFKSIGSLNSLLMVAITFLSMYGDEIITWVKNLFKGKEAVDTLKKAEEALHDARVKGYKDSLKERTEADLLYKATQDVNRSMEERNAAVDELQRRYPKYLDGFSNEEVLAGKASEAYGKLTNSLIAAAQARAAQEKIEEVASKRLEKELALTEKEARMNELEAVSQKGTATTVPTMVATMGQGMYASNVAVLTDEAYEYNKVAEEVKQLNDEIKEYDALIDKIAGKVNVTDLFQGGDTSSSGGDTSSSGGDTSSSSDSGNMHDYSYRELFHSDEEIEAMANEWAKKVQEAKARALSANEESYSWESLRLQQYMSEELDLLTEQYANGVIDKENYEKQKEAITSKYGKEQVALSIDFLKQQLDVANLAEEERLSILQEITKKEIELSEKVRDEKVKNAEEANKKVKVSNEELLSFFSDAIGGIGELAGALSERKLQALEEEEEANNEAYEKELERIDHLAETGAISEEEAEARKRAAEDKTAAKEAELAKKKAEIQTRQAKLDKAISITQTIIATALGIMQTIKKIGMPAAIPFIAMQSALGAIQLATIIAQPIPKYAKGTKGHQGGLAIVGDGGRQEAVITDDGVWATPAVPTLVDLPKGAMVLPDLKDLRGKSDLLYLIDQRNRLRGDGVTVTVNNDYTRLEQKIEGTSGELRQIKKLLKRQGLLSERAMIYGRL